jgi:hypothetical protein
MSLRIITTSQAALGVEAPTRHMDGGRPPQNW